MTISEIDDHAEKIKERYPDRYKTAENHQKLIDIIGSRFQGLETQLFNMLDQRHLSAAVGLQLDGLGQILDLSRGVGETDTSYRANLIGRTGELSKSGEIESLISAFVALTGAVFVWAGEYYPAGVSMIAHVESDPEDPDVDAAIVEQMNIVKAGGVELTLQIILGLSSFEFSDVSEVDGSNNGPIDADKGFGGLNDFVALGQTPRNWIGMTTGLNGDVYASVSVGGDIYKQTGGTGNFVALGQTPRNWRSMTTGLNGDIYVAVSGDDIYKQTGGTGNFVALGQTPRNWTGMTTGLNGDVYASVSGDDIYKQTGGTGNFVALGQVSIDWRSMTTGLNGDVYAAVAVGDIYKQTGGTGNFVALGQTSRNWIGMTTGLNGDVYASVSVGGDIYKQTGGTGNFVALGQTPGNWTGMTTGLNGDVYASVSGDDIYKLESEGGGLSRVI